MTSAVIIYAHFSGFFATFVELRNMSL